MRFDSVLGHQVLGFFQQTTKFKTYIFEKKAKPVVSVIWRRWMRTGFISQGEWIDTTYHHQNFVYIEYTADVMELVYVLVLEAKFCGFESHHPHH